MPEHPPGDARRAPARRIVVVMMEPPLPFGNASARWYYVRLRGLVARGHRVTAFAVCGMPEELVRARDFFPASDYDLRLFPFPTCRGPRSKWETWRQPYSYPFSPDLRRDLDAALAQGFDILHLERLAGVEAPRSGADQRPLPLRDRSRGVAAENLARAGETLEDVRGRAPAAAPALIS